MAKWCWSAGVCFPSAFLLQLAGDDGEQIAGVSHQDLADVVGTCRETVTRILNEFRSEGYIDLGRLHVNILQRDALDTIAEA